MLYPWLVLSAKEPHAGLLRSELVWVHAPVNATIALLPRACPARALSSGNPVVMSVLSQSKTGEVPMCGSEPQSLISR